MMVKRFILLLLCLNNINGNFQFDPLMSTLHCNRYISICSNGLSVGFVLYQCFDLLYSDLFWQYIKPQSGNQDCRTCKILGVRIELTNNLVKILQITILITTFCMFFCPSSALNPLYLMCIVLFITRKLCVLNLQNNITLIFFQIFLLFTSFKLRNYIYINILLNFIFILLVFNVDTMSELLSYSINEHSFLLSIILLSYNPIDKISLVCDSFLWIFPLFALTYFLQLSLRSATRLGQRNKIEPVLGLLILFFIGYFIINDFIGSLAKDFTVFIAYLAGDIINCFNICEAHIIYQCLNGKFKYNNIICLFITMLTFCNRICVLLMILLFVVLLFFGIMGMFDNVIPDLSQYTYLKFLSIIIMMLSIAMCPIEIFLCCNYLYGYTDRAAESRALFIDLIASILISGKYLILFCGYLKLCLMIPELYLISLIICKIYIIYQYTQKPDCIVTAYITKESPIIRDKALYYEIFDIKDGESISDLCDRVKKAKNINLINTAISKFSKNDEIIASLKEARSLECDHLFKRVKDLLASIGVETVKILDSQIEEVPNLTDNDIERLYSSIPDKISKTLIIIIDLYFSLTKFDDQKSYNDALQNIFNLTFAAKDFSQGGFLLRVCRFPSPYKSNDIVLPDIIIKYLGDVVEFIGDFTTRN